MAITTTPINACDAVIKAQNTEGTLLDISGSSNQATMDLTNQIGQTNVFGGAWPIRCVCKADATVNLRIVYTTHQSEAMQLLKDWFYNHRTDTRRIQIFLPDSDEGSDRYQFDCKLASLNIPVDASSADPILVTAVLNPTGEFTWAFVAS